MPPQHSNLPRTAQPTSTTFDPWNSSSTGHQRAENRLAGSTSWRDSRTLKLREQFADAAATGGKRMFDTVGAGSVDFGKDGRKPNGGWEDGAVGVRREMGVRDVGALLTRGAAAVNAEERREQVRRAGEFPETISAAVVVDEGAGGKENAEGGAGQVVMKKKERGVFDGLCIYINGSTHPLVSDHKLRHLLAQHGARLSLALGRRSVTHVIVGRPNSPSGSRPGSSSGSGSSSGAGGGLSGSKIQREIDRVRGCGVKFVGVEWALASLKAGVRLKESGFAVVGTAPRGVKSVEKMFERQRGAAAAAAAVVVDEEEKAAALSG